MDSETVTGKTLGSPRVPRVSNRSSRVSQAMIAYAMALDTDLTFGVQLSGLQTSFLRPPCFCVPFGDSSSCSKTGFPRELRGDGWMSWLWPPQSLQWSRLPSRQEVLSGWWGGLRGVSDDAGRFWYWSLSLPQHQSELVDSQAAAASGDKAIGSAPQWLAEVLWSPLISHVLSPRPALSASPRTAGLHSSIVFTDIVGANQHHRSDVDQRARQRELSELVWFVIAEAALSWSPRSLPARLDADGWGSDLSGLPEGWDFFGKEVEPTAGSYAGISSSLWDAVSEAQRFALLSRAARLSFTKVGHTEELAPRGPGLSRSTTARGRSIEFSAALGGQSNILEVPPLQAYLAPRARPDQVPPRQMLNQHPQRQYRKSSLSCGDLTVFGDDPALVFLGGRWRRVAPTRLRPGMLVGEMAALKTCHSRSGVVSCGNGQRSRWWMDSAQGGSVAGPGWTSAQQLFAGIGPGGLRCKVLGCHTAARAITPRRSGRPLRRDWAGDEPTVAGSRRQKRLTQRPNGTKVQGEMRLRPFRDDAHGHPAPIGAPPGQLHTQASRARYSYDMTGMTSGPTH
jgi:hypothetical protein